MKCSFRRSFLGPVCERQATKLIAGLDEAVGVRWKRPVCGVCSIKDDYLAKISSKVVVLHDGDDFVVWEIMES